MSETGQLSWPSTGCKQNWYVFMYSVIEKHG